MPREKQTNKPFVLTMPTNHHHAVTTLSASTEFHQPQHQQLYCASLPSVGVAGVYPFFLDCASRVDDPRERSMFEHLSVGCGALIRQRPSGRVVVVGDRGREFVIPKTFDDEAFRAARGFLSDARCKDDKTYDDIEAEILESRTEWRNVRKKERTRLVDEYVRSRYHDSATRKTARVFMTIALLLKLITPKDISYVDYAIRSIRGEFLGFAFNGAAPPHPPHRSGVSCSGDTGISSPASSTLTSAAAHTNTSDSDDQGDYDNDDDDLACSEEDYCASDQGGDGMMMTTTTMTTTPDAL